MDFEGYEDQFARSARVLRRAARAARWTMKTALGVPRRLLVETRWRLGDEVMALPLFESLRAQFPSDHLAVLTNFPELYERHPFVDGVNEWAEPDRYLLLRGAPRTVFRLEAYARRVRVPMPVSRPHLYFDDWTLPPAAADLGNSGPVVAVAPGTTWPVKHWPRERWLALCEALAGAGCRLVELGKDHAPLGAGACLVGRTTVREAACVLHHADVLVSCDSGLMHLALAAGTAVVALFGPTDPDILIRNEPNFLPVISRQNCRGYWNRPGPEPRTDVCPLGHTCCLADISVAEVLEAVGKRIHFR